MEDAATLRAARDGDREAFMQPVHIPRPGCGPSPPGCWGDPTLATVPIDQVPALADRRAGDPVLRGDLEQAMVRLDPAQRFLAERHLGQCPRCQAAAVAFDRLDERARQVLLPDGPAATFEAALAARLAAEPGGRRPVRRPGVRRRLWLGGLAAALSVLALVLVVRVDALQGSRGTVATGHHPGTAGAGLDAGRRGARAEEVRTLQGRFTRTWSNMPGDALHVPDRPIETLLVPVHGPWLKLAEAIDFAKDVEPERTFAIHDGQLNRRGLASVNNWFSGEASGYRYLAAGNTASPPWRPNGRMACSTLS